MRAGTPRTDAGRLALALEVGNSHFFADRSAMVTARSLIYERGGKAAFKAAVENGVDGWRLWKTEPCSTEIGPNGPPRARVELQCKRCGSPFYLTSSKARLRIHCSKRCHNESMVGTKRESGVPKRYRACESCGKKFRVYPSMTQRYCSYECHLRSGGAFRAGLASAAAVRKYGAKKDANHTEIIAAMRKLCPVYDMSSHGHGLPDGVAWVGDSSWQFFDIKNPETAYGRRGLNAIQKKWLGNRKGGPVFLIYTVAEAEQFAKGNFEDLKFECGDSLYMNE